jgi:PAS domain S-box-containing protein
LRASWEFHEKNQGTAFRLNGPSYSWLGAVGLFVAVGIAYFLAARVGLVLGSNQGVPIFWPAAGIAVGAFITLGPNARLPVAVAVVAATIASGILIGRSLSLTITFAFFNTGEALLTAWFIERWFGRAFTLETVRQVLGFVVASAVSETIAATGAGIVVHILEPATSSAHAWRLWFASCSLGIFTVAPLLIGLGQIVRELPPRRELIEGTVGLATLAALSVFVISLPRSPWATALPVALVLPVLLWISVRCRPAFAAAAMFIVALAVIWSTTFEVVRFADVSVPLSDRTLAAQTLVLAAALLALVLAALFAERRHNEVILKSSNDRLQLALDSAELGIWSLHLKTGRFENDVRDRHIHGHGPDAPPLTLAQLRSQVHPDDLSDLDAAFMALGRAGDSCRAEYRLAPRTDEERSGRERWVAIEGAVVHREDGRPVQLLGVTRDITERKHAEAKLQESERASRELLGALPAAIYVTDAAGRITYCNEGAVNLWGARPKLGEDRWSDFARYYHADGAPMALEDCPTEIALKQGRTVRGQEAILERADGTRIPIAPYPTPIHDRTGAVVGVVNMTVDISERKHAEQVLAERNVQLTLASKFALVGTFTLDVASERMQVTSGYVAIHRLPECTEEISRDDWRRGVHPDDLPCVEVRFKQAMAEGRREHYCEYRIVHSDGEIRWIDSRSLISYDRDGAARVIGANIDITQRKQTEAALKEHKASLTDALTAGQVMAFHWDAVTGQSRRSDNAALIFGIEQDWGHSSPRNEFLRWVHPDDRRSLKTQVRQLCPSNPSYALIFRFCCPNGEQVWLEETAKGEFDAAGRLLRIKGLTRNITLRKKAELALIERNVQLALAGKAGLVGSYAYDTDTEIMQISEGYAAIHGFPERTTEIARSECLATVHSDDSAHVELRRSEALHEQRREYGVEYRIIRPSDEVRWIETRCFITYDAVGYPKRVVGVSIDITERKRAEEHQQALVAELDHRVKNVLATVSAVAGHTLETSCSMSHFVAALDGRIRSMATAHELLSTRRWRGMPMAELVRREFLAYASNNNITIDGPEVMLSAEAGQAMAMVIHELVTNAAKYGALSTQSGHVSVRWYRKLNGSPKLVLVWQETGGPRVEAPKKSGYGTGVVRDLVPYEFGGKVDLSFAPEGVRCRLEIPFDRVSSSELLHDAELPSSVLLTSS